MRWLFTLVVVALLGLVQAVSTSGDRLLVVLEELGEKSRFSKFWGDLEDRGYKITFESPKNEKLSLFKHGARAYDHLILLPPKSKGLGPALAPNILLDFLNAQGNILLTLSSTSPTPSAISSLLLELDIQLPADRTSIVVDHFNYDTLSAAEKHDVVLLPRPTAFRSGVKNFFAGANGDVIAFPRGVGHLLGNASPLLTPVLRAPSTAYAYNPKDEPESSEDPFAAGSQLSLVSVMQARNSARFTILGSAEMLENTWFDTSVKQSLGVDGAGKNAKKTKAANREFAKQISQWTFMELGVLKVGRVQHNLVQSGNESKGNVTISGPVENPTMYRIKNDVIFTIELSEYMKTHWSTFTPSGDDELQLEFSMLSPFHRLPLKPLPSSSANSTSYSAEFRLPDQHGIFNFRVNYKRPFLTTVDEKYTVTVRHFAHDEWPRSWAISGAWPWIAGVWTTVVAWISFVGIWLYCEPREEDRKGKAKKVQ